jgi:hypothetical protein
MTYTAQPLFRYVALDYEVTPLSPWNPVGKIHGQDWILKESFICQGCRDKMARGEAVACMCYIPERDNRVIW